MQKKEKEKKGGGDNRMGKTSISNNRIEVYSRILEIPRDHEKMVTIKDTIGNNLKEAENIKKR